MRPRALLADLRVLESHAIARRGALVALSCLIERVLTPALAWTLMERALTSKIGVSLAFGGVVTMRTLLQRVAVARTEAELVVRIGTSVLRADVMRGGGLPERDLRLEATQAVYHSSVLLAQTLPGLCADVLACGLLSVVVAAFEPFRVVALAVAVTLVGASALLASRRAVAGAIERVWQRQGFAYEAFGDALEGRLDIVASGRRGAFLADLAEKTRAWGRAGAQAALATMLSGRLALLTVAGFVAAAIAGTGRIAGIPSLTLWELALFASVTPAFSGLAQAAYVVARDDRWLHLLADVLRDAVSSHGGGFRSVPTLPAPIALDHVTFRYQQADPRRRALEQVTVAWDGREVLAFSGANGSGKSTCLRLLLALAPPSEGAIRVGPRDLAEVDPDAWRALIAFLPQRAHIPPRASIRSAVRWPMSGVTDARILEAMQRVDLLNVLERAGTSPLDVRVDTLSVGQRQRVALARLLCTDAALYLLDEPDANLDRAGITLVAELIKELSGRAMVAFAAHTPELLEVADRVVHLKDGRVIEPPVD